MVVEKEMVVRVKTTDGKEIYPGEMVAITARGYTYVGRYLGISGRGGLTFDGLQMGDVQAKFSLMPSSISKIYKCNVELQMVGDDV